MDKVTIDATLRAKLGDLSRQFELYDESGQRLGFYVPAPTYDPALYEWAKSQISDEELRRRAEEPGGYTTAEVLQHLEELQRQEEQ
jgi:hypothetical protein